MQGEARRNGTALATASSLAKVRSEGGRCCGRRFPIAPCKKEPADGSSACRTQRKTRRPSSGLYTPTGDGQPLQQSTALEEQCWSGRRIYRANQSADLVASAAFLFIYRNAKARQWQCVRVTSSPNCLACFRPMRLQARGAPRTR